MKLGGRVEHGQRTNPFNVGVDPNHRAEVIFHFLKHSHCNAIVR